MPLPHPPGYQPLRQSRVDRRRLLLLVLAAAGCGAWGETMRQLAGIARASDPEG